jgi:hypothetical protein
MDRGRVQWAIREVCDELGDFLIKKNEDYGNSFADPVGIFSKLSPLDQLNVRIDDKLKRIKNAGDKNFDEDTELDLVGYLILKRVLLRISSEK